MGNTQDTSFADQQALEEPTLTITFSDDFDSNQTSFSTISADPNGDASQYDYSSVGIESYLREAWTSWFELMPNAQFSNNADIEIFVGYNVLQGSSVAAINFGFVEDESYAGSITSVFSELLTGVDNATGAYDATISVGPDLGTRYGGITSVMAHEIGHALGFVSGDTLFNTFIVDSFFMGENAVAEHGGPVPVQFNGHVPNPAISVMGGNSLFVSALDIAILTDLGLYSVADVRLVGTASDDTLTGDIGNDVLIGGAGSDDLRGMAGNDQLWAGPQDAGNDILAGGTGKDTLGGGAGNDTGFGGSGEDLLYGGVGDDNLFGETGNDVIWGGAGNDLAFGGAGNDTIGGGLGADTLSAGSEDDVLYASSGADFLNGDTGNDTLFGGDGNDTLIGGNGNDELYVGEGTDTIVFGINHGDDSIGGFVTRGDNLIDFTELNLSGFEALTLVETTDGVSIQTGEGTINLWNVSIAEVASDDFLF